MRHSILRGSRLSSRPFYTTLLLISLFASFSFLLSVTGSGAKAVRYNDYQIVKRSHQPECRQVRTAKDQCAFIREHCGEENAGLLPYLEFYYCTLGKAQPVAFAALVAWLGLLFTTIGIAASDFFSVNLSTIAAILGLSESLAGVTFLAFGNGSPDVFSTFAAMGSNSASMAVGELIGAAGFITGVVAGSMALVREFQVDRKSYARDICFFIVAVCFAVVFLADGHLHFWECLVMIGYYILYVVTVVAWHWWTKRRKRRQRREGAARSHFYGMLGNADNELAGEPYRDDPNDSDQDGRASPVTVTSRHGDASTLLLDEAPRIEIDGIEPTLSGDIEEQVDKDNEDTEDHERMVAAEVASSMRVLRTRSRRSHTKTAIRPSLVGALEFRSALAQLQRESNLQLSAIPSLGRSNSEAVVTRRGTMSAYPQIAGQGSQTLSAPSPAGTRNRAMSASDAFTTVAPGETFNKASQEPESSFPAPHSTSAEAKPPGGPSHPPVQHYGNTLAPPGGQPGSSGLASEDLSPRATPQLQLQIPSRASSISAGSSGSNTPFPHYTDSPMVMTPRLEPGGVHIPTSAISFPDLHAPLVQPKPVRWWPYRVLPPPHILLATLFPTLQGWRDKTIWNKFVSTISVPSIFLLVITLPVVESDGFGGSSIEESVVDGASRLSISHPATPVIEESPPAVEGEWERYRRHALHRQQSYTYNKSASYPNLENEETLVDTTSQLLHEQPPFATKLASDVPSVSNANDETSPWNRWLVCLQLFTGPQFAVFILWANLSEDWANPGKELARMVLYTLLGSLILLAILVLFTSEQERPKHHYILCFLGFIISIAWISTIAEEVVGVLKAIGVILGISEALLGLTIFAAGNSVGDLVADITVARLGYPVMALSACFGGPMLNILLGIGIGGVLMMVNEATKKHKHHPDKPIEYGPYRVEVSGTLMISAITLLMTLLGLLVIVPMNKWILSRRIGYGLIALWVVSTAINVTVELTGAFSTAA